MLISQRPERLLSPPLCIKIKRWRVRRRPSTTLDAKVTESPMSLAKFLSLSRLKSFFCTRLFFFLIRDVLENFRLPIYFPLDLEVYYFDRLFRILDLVFVQLDSFTPFGRFFVFSISCFMLWIFCPQRNAI